MKLTGCKINFLGDSITEGVGVSTLDNVYWARLARDQGLAVARNYGIGGSRIARQSTFAGEATVNRHDLDFCYRAPQMEDDADVVVVFGGTNDFGHGDAPIGSPDDRTPDTFIGACHTLFLSLMEKYPAATIVVMTPLHRWNEDFAHDGEHTEPLYVYVDIIRQIAAYYALPVLDLWSVSGIQPRVDVIKERFCPDGLHPNDAGHALIASRLAGFLKSL